MKLAIYYYKKNQITFGNSIKSSSLIVAYINQNSLSWSLCEHTMNMTCHLNDIKVGNMSK